MKRVLLGFKIVKIVILIFLFTNSKAKADLFCVKNFSLLQESYAGKSLTKGETAAIFPLLDFYSSYAKIDFSQRENSSGEGTMLEVESAETTMNGVLVIKAKKGNDVFEGKFGPFTKKDRDLHGIGRITYLGKFYELECLSYGPQNLIK